MQSKLACITFEYIEPYILYPRTSRNVEYQIAIDQGRYDVVCPAKSAWELHQVRIELKV